MSDLLVQIRDKLKKKCRRIRGAAPWDLEGHAYGDGRRHGLKEAIKLLDRATADAEPEVPELDAFHEALRQYMLFIIRMEGTTFLEYLDHADVFTPEAKSLLDTIAVVIKANERGGEQGLATGCSNPATTNKDADNDGR